VVYKIDFSTEAIDDLRRTRAFDRAAILETIERILTDSPTQTGQSRIKRLRGIDSPQYRLRVGEMRIFYDVDADSVLVIRILPKAAVDEFLKEIGHEG